MTNDKLKFLGKKLAQLDLTEFYPTLETKQQENPEVFDFIHGVVSDDRWEDNSIKEARSAFVELIKMEKLPSKSPSFKITNDIDALGSFRGFGSGLSKLLDELMKKESLSDDERKENKLKVENEIKSMSENDKIKMLITYAETLGIKDIPNVTDKLFDRAHSDIKFFNETAASVKYMMLDDHYKKCNCVKMKYEILLEASSYNEAREKANGSLMKGEADD